VLIIGHPSQVSDGTAIERSVIELGFTTCFVVTPGEALWQLGDREHGFIAVLIDGDPPYADRFELISFVSTAYPSLRQLLLITKPVVSEFERCEVVDKYMLRDALAAALGPSNAERDRDPADDVLVR
jgi:hypothetical protein